VRTLVFVVVSVISMAACSKDGGSSLNPNGPSANLPSQPLNLTAEETLANGWAGNSNFPGGHYRVTLRSITPGGGSFSISANQIREIGVNLAVTADFGQTFALAFRKSNTPLQPWDKNSKDARMLTSLEGEPVENLGVMSFEVSRMLGGVTIDGTRIKQVVGPESVGFLYVYFLSLTAPGLDPVTTRVVNRLDYGAINWNLLP
jgi:hypothetical protein